MRLNQLNEERFRKHFYLISILILTLSVLTVFQNCAPVVENSLNSGSSNGLPFGYDTKVDAFGYMSCTGVPESATYQRGFFTYRVSANNSANGLKMSPAFIAATQTANATKRAQLLAEQAVNGSAQLNFALRLRNSYNSGAAKNPGHSTHLEGTDFDNMLLPLSNPAIAGPITQAETASPGSRVQFFPGIPTVNDRLFEGSMRFGSSMAGEASIRNLVASQDYIASLGYIDSTQPTIPRAIAADGGDGAKIYGIGYKPQWGTSFARASAIDGTPIPYPASTAANAPRVLNGVTPYDMATGLVANENWSCPSGTSGASFMIVRSQDLITAGGGVGKAFCNTSLPDSNDPLTLAIRKVLPATHWKIDVANRCVVAIDPTTAQPSASYDVCYGGTTVTTAPANFVVNYTGTYGPAGNASACNYDLSGAAVQITVSGTPRHVLCPHYVSVCVRN